MSAADAAFTADYLALSAKLETVVMDKWPEALAGVGNPFQWARDHQPELMKQYDALYREVNELWSNGRAAEFKKSLTQWGQTVLKVMKLYAGHLRQGGAA